MGSNPSYFTGSPAAGEVQEKRPVEQVSWYDALVYCNRRSLAENLTPCYSIGGSTDPDAWGGVPTSSSGTWNAATCNFAANGYRLPTVAEWVQAASDGHECSGADTASLGTVAWYSGNSDGKTHEVKTKDPNAKGIYDMSGNVWEWCWDIYSSTLRVIRGGSWNRDASLCAVSYPDYGTPDYRYSHGGFRLVRTAD